MNMDSSHKAINYLSSLGLLLSIGPFSSVSAGGMGSEIHSGWYLGASVSAVWASLPDNMTVNNGGPVPYDNDLFSVSHGRDTALAIQAGYEWQRPTSWLPVYSLGLQYEHFWVHSMSGTITQYSLPEFLNYSYSWDNQIDTISLYTKLHLLECGLLRPFVTGGVGLAINRSGQYYESAFVGATQRYSPGFGRHTQTNLAYNLGVGIEYSFSSELGLSLAYTYENLGDLRSGNGVNTWAADYLTLKNFQVNMLTVGMTYRFDS